MHIPWDHNPELALPGLQRNWTVRQRRNHACCNIIFKKTFSKVLISGTHARETSAKTWRKQNRPQGSVTPRGGGEGG